MKKILLASAVAATALLSSCGNSTSSSSLKTNIDTISYALGASSAIPEMYVKQGLQQMGSDSAYVKEFQQGIKDGIASANDKKSLAYNIGLQQGMNMSQRGIQGVSQHIYGNDSSKSINVDLFLAGLMDAMNQKGIALKNAEGADMTQEELGTFLNTAINEARTQQMEVKYGAYKQENIDFMAKVAQEEGVKELGNGVYYKELVAGEGAKAEKGNSLELTYEGRLIDGTVFDQTAEGKTTEFPVGEGRAIAGFDAAMAAMAEGAEWEVYIPADQAYGEMESGKIKPFSTLIFKIKAVKVIKADKK